MKNENAMLLCINGHSSGQDAPSATPLYVRANSVKEAVHWLLDNDERFADPSGIFIEKLPALIDLVPTVAKLKVVPVSDVAPKEPPAAKAPQRTAPAAAPGDELTMVQVMQLTGLNIYGVKNRMTSGKFERAGRGTCTKASVDAWLAKGGKSVEKQDPGRIERMNAARAAKRGKHATAPKPVKVNAPAPVAEPGKENFMHEDKLAEELNMDIELLRMIKAAGKVAGGFGWVDRSAFETYMDSDEYRESLD